MATLQDLATGAFGIAVGLPALYLGFLAAVTLRPRRASRSADARRDPLTFAILVPAHDEELAIGHTVTNLLRLDYPAERFSVHVVADNCSDGTAAAARRHGACVHERNDARLRGKGAALNWLEPEVAREVPQMDAFVVVDADSELSADFLSVMTRHLRSGAQVVQALNLVDVSDDRPLVRIRELAFELACHLRPLAYEILGGSSALHGNGMCFSATLGRRYRWSESSVVEDAEMFLRLVRDGHRVELASDAAVHSVMPTSFRDGGSQAVRWEHGRLQYLPDQVGLLWRGLRRRDPNALFAGLGILVLPFAILVAASVLGFVAGVATGGSTLALVALGSLLCLVFYAMRGAKLGGMSARVLLRILLWAPFYAMWKVWVVTLAAFGVGRGDWTRTARMAHGRRPG